MDFSSLCFLLKISQCTFFYLFYIEKRYFFQFGNFLCIQNCPNQFWVFKHVARGIKIYFDIIFSSSFLPFSFSFACCFFLNKQKGFALLFFFPAEGLAHLGLPFPAAHLGLCQR